jgi:hypothetical protein
MFLKILLVAAIVGASMAFFFGNRTKEDAATGAAGGVMVAFSFLVQLFFFGIMSIAGIWLVSRIL